MSEPRIKTSGKRMEMAEEQFPAPPPELGEVTELTIEETGEFLASLPMDDLPPDPRSWRLMDEAPKDGTLIEVKADPDDPDDAAVTTIYRKTSRRDGPNRRWVPRNYWSNALTRDELPFEPFCWRMPVGFLLPGMVSA